MRKIILISAAAAIILVLSGAGFAAQGVGMNPFMPFRNDINPFMALRNDINELDTQVSLLQGQINGLQLQINTILPAVQTASFNALFFVDGIPGDINDPNDPAHQNWIGVDSYSWSISGSQSSGAGGASTPAFTDLMIVHRLDKSSVKLYEACSKGTLIREVILELRRSTGEKAKYMEYKLSNAFVTSVKPTVNGSGDEVPTEQVSFRYEKIEYIYTPADGNQITAGWDLVKGGVL